MADGLMNDAAAVPGVLRCELSQQGPVPARAVIRCGTDGRAEIRCDGRVDFCTTLIVPAGYRLDPKDLQFSFASDQLRVAREQVSLPATIASPCAGHEPLSLEVAVNRVRVVGSISYIVALGSVLGTAGAGALSAVDSVAVDAVISHTPVSEPAPGATVSGAYVIYDQENVSRDPCGRMVIKLTGSFFLSRTACKGN